MTATSPTAGQRIRERAVAALDTTRVYLRHHGFYLDDELIAGSGRILPEELQ